MTSQHYPIMHVLVRSLIINYNFSLSDVPKKILKFAAKEYDDYLSYFKKETDLEYENTKESKIISEIFEMINRLGYYKLPETMIEETLNAG